MDDWLKLASHLHMPLRKVMRETSLNDFHVWMKWLDDQWDNPTLTDYYIMSVAQSIWQVNSETPGNIKLNSFKLSRKSNDGEMSEEQIAKNLEMTFSIWSGILGGNANNPGIDFSKLKLKAWE